MVGAVLQLGIAGSMATIGSLNVQWWAQDRGRADCWVDRIAVLDCCARADHRRPRACPGAESLAGDRADAGNLIGMIVAMFVGTLSACTVPLPDARAAIVPAWRRRRCSPCWGWPPIWRTSSSETRRRHNCGRSGILLVGVSAVVVRACFGDGGPLAARSAAMAVVRRGRRGSSLWRRPCARTGPAVPGDGQSGRRRSQSCSPGGAAPG